MVLGLLHGPVLTGLASLMVIRDPLERADLILPLGQGETILSAAAALHHRGYAGRVAVARTRPQRLELLGLLPPPHEISREVLMAEGVPPEAIITIGSQIRDDVELGRALAAFFENRAAGRVIVVVSAPFSRLTRHDLRRGLAGFPVEMRIYPVPPREFDERTWWRSRRGLLTHFDVLVLLTLRLLRG